jgi:RimJ/RimL family protein N-acetyltransferase
MDVFEGRLVRMRSIEPEDAVAIHRWCNDPAVIRWLGDRYPVSLPGARCMVERGMDGDFANLLTAVETVGDNVFIGTGRIKGAEPESRDGEVDLWIGERDFWGRGHGSEALGLLCGIGFDVMGLHRLTASIYADNHASLHVFQKAGFLVEGRLRSARWKNGRWRDVVLLGMLADDRPGRACVTAAREDPAEHHPRRSREPAPGS